ncbi:hypothetical protein E2C01_068515 [Portunus trituberculatus]|uniref:Transmembrane protein n=1 Tax=Portunus trituberculatus TaxID=210409 RepID=A0A5B7HWC0_PORTR|nr:hypothetical protein [Portunus trituberculatus]
MMQLTANLTPMIGKLVVAAVARDLRLAAAARSRRGEGIVTRRPSATWRATYGGRERERQTTSLRLLLVTSVVGGVASLSFVRFFSFLCCVRSFLLLSPFPLCPTYFCSFLSFLSYCSSSPFAPPILHFAYPSSPCIIIFHPATTQFSSFISFSF